VEENTTYHTR